MMNTKLFLRKYRSEIIITSIATLFSIIITIFVTAWFQTSDVRIIINILIGTIVVLLLLAILFNLKTLISNLIFNLKRLEAEHVLFDNIDLFSPAKYYERSTKDYAQEKRILAQILVEKVLPNVIEQMLIDLPNLNKLNIVIGSGATLTSVFPHLLSLGLPEKENVKYSIFTNNLAGISEIYKLDYRNCQLSEEDINLIGGNPLSSYRATVGDVPNNFLNEIREKEKNSNGKIATLSILTTGWLLGGLNLTNISLSSKAVGHFDFNSSAIHNSNYVVILTPLGTILRIENAQQLNKVLPYDTSNQYHSQSIPNTVKTFLLTTFRSKNSFSPLVNLSYQLQKIKESKTMTNYIICEDCPIYDPPGDKHEVIFQDLPHPYIRDNFLHVYGYRFS